MKKKGVSREEALNFLLETYKSKNVIVFGVPLPQYCNEHNININSIYAYASYLRKYKNLPKNESYIAAIEQYNTKFVLYNNIMLIDFCKEHNYNYNTIMSLRYKFIKRKKYNAESATNEAVACYERFIGHKQKRSELKFLREYQNNETQLKKYVQYKKYDQKFLKIIVSLGYNLYKSILIYEYLLDKKVDFSNDNIIVSEIIKTQSLVQHIIVSNDNIDLTELLNLYNAGYESLILNIFNSLRKTINKAVYQNSYYDKEEMRQHIDLLVIEKLKNTHFFHSNQLMFYMKKFIRGELVKYYHSVENNFSYNKNIYDNREYIDYIADDVSIEDVAISKVINDELYKELKVTLSTLQMRYILYRFGFLGIPHTIEETAIKLKIAPEVALKYEEEILSTLRGNSKILKIVR
jgi:hypothetical protein